MISNKYIQNAVKEARGFAIKQPHITYDLNVLQKSQTPDSLYCGELVWAAYSLGSGGKVAFLPDLNHWTDVKYGEINFGNKYDNLGVTPSDIAKDSSAPCHLIF